jgi:hypothetical protein
MAAVVALVAVGTALGADRIPVRSVDDTSISLVHRIGAVDNVVVAMGARIDRILGSLPEGHPPSPILEALTATQGSLHTLIATIDTRLCTTDGVVGPGDASLADSDTFAGDTSASGLTNQLGSVRTVLAEANGRLVRIAGAFPPGPPVREIHDALTAVRHSAAVGFDAIAGRLGGAIYPPSPCHLS